MHLLLSHKPYRTLRSAVMCVGTVAFAWIPIVALSGPSVLVTGNSVRVPAGIATSLSNNTRFQPALVSSQSFTNEFEIRNMGNSTLSISSITIGGDSPSQFSLAQAAAASVEPDQRTTFAIKFAPQSAGPASATITIASSDPVTPSLQFSVFGTGLDTPLPVEPQDVVAFFSEPIKLKSKDGQTFASGTIFIGNARAGLTVPLDCDVHLKASANHFVDFTQSFDFETDATIAPPDPTKLIRYQKVKFSMPVPDETFTLFGVVNPSDTLTRERNPQNNVFSAKVFQLDL